MWVASPISSAVTKPADGCGTAEGGGLRGECQPSTIGQADQYAVSHVALVETTMIVALAESYVELCITSAPFLDEKPRVIDARFA
jgi:hypothetical protein